MQTSDGADHVRVTLAELQELVERALTRGGMSTVNATAIAAGIVACERDGVKSHGLVRLPGFLHSVAIGWADGRAVPQIVQRGVSLAIVDARNGFAQAALALARDPLVAMARATGVAVLAIRNAHHFAALWPDIEPFAEAGLLALTCVNSKKRMAVWGGGKPVVGTNAMAFACPRAGRPPLIWDQSSSVLSQGDVLLAAKEKRDVALGVGCDSDGKPTTSPVAILDGGALLAFAGHKGASIAIMVEILAAAFTGSSFGFEDTSSNATGTTSRGGQFVLLIDPQQSCAEFSTRTTALTTALQNAGATRLPGDRRYRERRRSVAEGIVISKSDYAVLKNASD